MWRRRVLLVLCVCACVVGNELVNGEAEEKEEEEDMYDIGEEEVEERAFLLVQKKILETEVSDGTNVTIQLTVHNAGTRAAANVMIEDPKLPEGVEVLSKDEMDVPVERLGPGLSLKYRTVVRPSRPGWMELQPSKVTYAISISSSEKQVGYSTLAAFMVLTTNEYIISKVLLMGSYVTLGVLKTRREWQRFGLFAGVLLLMVGLNYLWKKLSEARRERMRRRATEYIEKSK